MLTLHSGRMLKRELEAREMSDNKLALALRLPWSCIIDLLKVCVVIPWKPHLQAEGRKLLECWNHRSPQQAAK